MAMTSKPKPEDEGLQARADTTTPTTPKRRGKASDGPTTYRYVGGQQAVTAVVAGTTYDFRYGQPVHLAAPDAGLDANPDFERVEGGER